MEACFRIHEMIELAQEALGDVSFVARREWVPPPLPPIPQSQLHPASAPETLGDGQLSSTILKQAKLVSTNA
jgi:hypothetical protein